jgi:uncharacterized phage protein gp47/JayE
MNYGITDSGFVIKTLPVIKQELESNFRSVFGQDIDVSESSVFGQIIGIMADRESTQWEQMQKVYYSQYRSSASGFSLDEAVNKLGIVRKQATKSTVIIYLEGDDGTIVYKSGTQYSMSETGNIFVPIEEQENISKLDINECALRIENNDDGDFTVVIDGVTCTYTASGDSYSDISSGIANAIESNYGSDIAYTVSSSDRYVIIKSNTALDIDSITSNLVYLFKSNCEAQQAGYLQTTPISVDTIESSNVDGTLDSVINLEPGNPGTNTETDTELRQRAELSVRLLGSASISAIKARILQNIENASQVFIYENTSDVTVDGRPPHSFETIISGGNEQEIAQLIWDVKPAGIQTVSTANPSGDEYKEITVKDVNNNDRTVYFSRPIDKYAHCRITINSFYDEEEYPDNGNTAVKNGVSDFGNNLGIGKDIIPQRLHAPIYNVPGIESIIVEIAITDNPGDSPSFTTGKVSIAANEISKWDISRITIIT